MLVAGLIHIMNIAFFPGLLKNGTNFPKQLLLKLPTQRPSSLPWGSRPGPIEHLNIFLFFFITSTNSPHCFLAHTAQAQHISAEDGLHCPLQIRHLDLEHLIYCWCENDLPHHNHNHNYSVKDYKRWNQRNNNNRVTPFWVLQGKHWLVLS